MAKEGRDSNHVANKTNQDQNREMREIDKKGVDGWCMKEEGEMDEKQN